MPSTVVPGVFEEVGCGDVVLVACEEQLAAGCLPSLRLILVSRL